MIVGCSMLDSRVQNRTVECGFHQRPYARSRFTGAHIKVLIFLDETEDVAELAGTEAVIELARAVNGQ